MTGQRSIFITGAASGIGRAAAQHFAARGWFVGLADLNEAGLAETAALLPKGQSSVHPMDVRDRAQWRAQLAAFTTLTGGQLHVLFNNAGVARGGEFAVLGEADHDIVIDVNFKSVVYGAEAGFAYLKATPDSCLLNTASASAFYGVPRMAVYSATKFAVRGLTEALDLEWAQHGIRVRSLMPGFIDTPLLDIATAGTNQSARERVVESGLAFTPVEQVAEAAWEAVHGSRVHIAVGKDARRGAFFARFFPAMVRKQFAKLGERN